MSTNQLSSSVATTGTPESIMWSTAGSIDNSLVIPEPKLQLVVGKILAKADFALVVPWASVQRTSDLTRISAACEIVAVRVQQHSV